MFPPRWVTYSILFALTLMEFIAFRKENKKFPYLEIVAAQTTYFAKKYFLQALLLVGYYDIATLLYPYRIYNIKPTNIGGIILLFLIVDFLYYWHHRMSHTVRLFWTSHCIHHLPKRLMVLSSYQQSLSGALLSPYALLILPLVFLGFSPGLLFHILGVNLLYQTWVHNEVIGKLGFLEWFLNTPAQHRIHHSTLEPHVNKNFGGILCIFDRIFKTYHLDDVQIQTYGTTHQFDVRTPFSPLIFEFKSWFQLWQNVFQAKGLRNKINMLIKI